MFIPIMVMLVPPDWGPKAGVAGGLFRNSIYGKRKHVAKDLVIVDNHHLYAGILHIMHRKLICTLVLIHIYHKLKISFRLNSIRAISKGNEYFVRYNTTLHDTSDTGNSAVELNTVSIQY